MPIVHQKHAKDNQMPEHENERAKDAAKMGGIAEEKEVYLDLPRQHNEELKMMQSYDELILQIAAQERTPRLVQTYLDTVRPFRGETDDLL